MLHLTSNTPLKVIIISQMSSEELDMLLRVTLEEEDQLEVLLEMQL